MRQFCYDLALILIISGIKKLHAEAETVGLAQFTHPSELEFNFLAE